MLQVKIKFRLLILFLFSLLVLIIHEYRLLPLFQIHMVTIISTNLFSDDEMDGVYVDPDITDSVNYQQPVMPPMPSELSTDQVYSAYTAISRKVVGKSARDNPERHCGWF